MTGIQVSNAFWEGIHLLHRFGFNVVLSICDGASENRKFIQSSAQTFVGYPKVQHVCVNTTNNGPLFFYVRSPSFNKKITKQYTL